MYGWQSAQTRPLQHPTLFYITISTQVAAVGISASQACSYSTRQNEVRGYRGPDLDQTGSDFTPLSPFLSGGLVPDHVRTRTVPE